MMTVLLILIAVLVVLAIIIALRPSEFLVERSIVINAPPEKIFPLVDDLRQMNAWSPWAKLDPGATQTYEGPPSGIGAVMRWAGKKSGAGSIVTTECRPNEFLKRRLDFLKPMKATNISEFNFKPGGGKTLVTWNMSGRNNFMAKAFGLFLDCEKMVGAAFEQGLASLKALAEKTS